MSYGDAPDGGGFQGRWMSGDMIGFELLLCEGQYGPQPANPDACAKFGHRYDRGWCRGCGKEKPRA